MRNPKEKKKEKIIFVAENLRIGGIQRMLLDECYQFLEWGYSTEIISLGKKLQEDDITTLDGESELITKIRITFLPKRRFLQLIYLRKVILNNPEESTRFIAHSTTGSALLRIASFLALKKITITLLIHQLMTLSDEKQKRKRMYQATSANKIQFSSLQFLLDWQIELDNHRILRTILNSRFSFNRMGIFLPRLNNFNSEPQSICKSVIPHLIYLSRISSWKGFETFSKISKEFLNEQMHTVIVTTQNANREIMNPDMFEPESVHICFNKSIVNLKKISQLIHLYPTNYGSNVRFPQSIGMNVLEMISCGIPNLISPDQLNSWPEFEGSCLIKQVDWMNMSEVKSSIEDALALTDHEKYSEILRLRKVISIESHCLNLLESNEKFPMNDCFYRE